MRKVGLSGNHEESGVIGNLFFFVLLLSFHHAVSRKYLSDILM